MSRPWSLSIGSPKRRHQVAQVTRFATLAEAMEHARVMPRRSGLWLLNVHTDEMFVRTANSGWWRQEALPRKELRASEGSGRHLAP